MTNKIKKFAIMLCDDDTMICRSTRIYFDTREEAREFIAKSNGYTLSYEESE